MFSKSKDDFFLVTSKNRHLSTLNAVAKGLGRAHTLEERQPVRHDVNFNSIHKTLQDSWLAAIILRNSDVFGDMVYDLVERFSSIYLADLKDEIFMDFVCDIRADVSTEGQFGKIPAHRVEEIVRSKERSAEVFAQKISILRAIGAIVINYARADVAAYHFLFKHYKRPVDALVDKNRPSDLFTVRGRSGLVSSATRSDLGILTGETYKRLNDEMKRLLTVNGLSGKRPLFRPRINERLPNGRPAFVERMFDRDEPVVASISGSTACIYVAAEILNPSMTAHHLQQLTASAIGLLVGGGYHSVSEVKYVRLPHFDCQNYVGGEMRKHGKEQEMGEYKRVLQESLSRFPG